MPQKKVRYNDYNASVEKNDTFGTIFESMLKHNAFQDLTCGQKMFYVYCRVQAQSKKGKQCLYNHGKKYNRLYDHNTDFVFPAEHLEQYGIKHNNGPIYFKALEKAGFIEYKEKNKSQQKVNVYSFSNKWKWKDNN